MGGIDDSLYTITSFREAIHVTYNYCNTKAGGEGVIFDNVRHLCREKGISITKLEDDLGFARSSVCKWNKNEPGIRKVQKVANYLGVSIEELLKETEDGR